MINVVLKSKEFVEQFKFILDNAGISYSVKMNRIFLVECDMDDFPFSDFPYIASYDAPIFLGKQKPMFEIEDENILIKTNPSEVPGVVPRSWGPHRIIRRKNPFKRERSDMRIDGFSLPHRQVRSGVGVDIYILDMGANCSLPEFGGRFREINSDSNTYVQQDAGDHATHVAACAIGNTVGIARGANAYFSFITGGQYDTDYINHLDVVYQHYISRAATNRPAVINWSWGTSALSPTPSPSAVAAFDEVIEAGITICVAAQNYNWDLDTIYSIPGEIHPDNIIVGGSNPFDRPYRPRLAEGTGVGSTVSIYSPSRYIVIPLFDGSGYASTRGTSFGCPFAAGVIACMLEGYQRLTSKAQVQSVKAKLIENSTKNALDFEQFYPNSVIHNRLLYLDPHIAFEEIPGLVPL